VGGTTTPRKRHSKSAPRSSERQGSERDQKRKACAEGASDRKHHAVAVVECGDTKDFECD